MHACTPLRKFPLHADAVAGALVACSAPADTCLAVVPKGPGSHDFAASLGLPFSAYEALEVAAEAECTPIDLGTLNKRQVGLLRHACMPPLQHTAFETHRLPGRVGMIKRSSRHSMRHHDT